MTEKFYRLTHEEWVKALALKPAPLKVLYYLRTLDPFGDRPLEMSVTEIAIAIGMNKSSVSRALKTLDQEGWIDLELVKVKITIKSGAKPLHSDNTVAPTQQPMHPRNERCTHATADAPTQQPMHPRNNRPPEPTPAQDSGSSQTNKTYSDFKQTLSDTTRESFEKFAFHKIQEARIGGEAIALPDRWLNKHWPTYWAEFKQKYPVMANGSSEDNHSAAPHVDEKVKMIKAAIADGTLLDYETREDFQRDERGGAYVNRPKVRSYLVQIPVTETWIDFEDWSSAGGHAVTPPSRQDVDDMIQEFVQGFGRGGSCP